MESFKKNVNPDMMETPDRCSLLMAINYLAFGEKPIPEKLAKLLYPERFTLELENHSYEYHEWQTLEVVWRNDKEKEIFETSSRELHALLILGQLRAYGTPLVDELEQPKGEGSKISSWYKSIKFGETEELLQDFWEGSRLKVDYIDSEAKADLFQHIQEHGAYTNIKIETDELLKMFPKEAPTKAKIEKRGRKMKYNWESFQTQIVMIANSPDGLPEKQVDLENIMADWCNETWNEIPGESTIREKISPIYQALLKARK